MDNQAPKCSFVFSNKFKATFPCQRPGGHRGAHSVTPHREDRASQVAPPARESETLLIKTLKERLSELTGLCGDHSCIFGSLKKGMGTNGGCRCDAKRNPKVGMAVQLRDRLINALERESDRIVTQFVEASAVEAHRQENAGNHSGFNARTDDVNLLKTVIAEIEAARTADSREAKMKREGITEEDIAETRYPEHLPENR